MLKEHGFRKKGKRVFEANITFDTAERHLFRRDELLRLRTIGKRGELTYKGPALKSRYKCREEIETEVADPGKIALLLARIGFKAAFRYEKYRSEYARPGEPGVVLLDETPIGDYLELEGPPAWIERTAALLGFRKSDQIKSTYGQLYLEYCNRNKIRPGDMLFLKDQGSQANQLPTGRKKDRPESQKTRKSS